MNRNFSYIHNADPAVIANLYEQYQANPESIDPEYRKFFDGFDYAVGVHDTNGTSAAKSSESAIPYSSDELKVYQLIDAYRRYSHLVSDTNPLRMRKDRGVRLGIENFGLKPSDLSKKFGISSIIGLKDATLQEIIDKLNKVYVGKIGFEFNTVRNQEELAWLQDYIENKYPNRTFTRDQKINALKSLNKAVVFEEFLGKKFVGEKRFSLEGGETTIPALQAIIEAGASLGCKEVVMGMAHRGRLNVLVNILHKTYEDIFNEFQGTSMDSAAGDGDVKYHKGYSSMYETPSGEVYVNLLANPSHLEAINPVAIGYSRAKADILYNSDFSQVLPLVIHGDAAVAGQGVDQEVAQMSLLKGYRVDGTIHFVINNQIGFTTDFDDARSSDYCTAVANLVNSPTFHVNGDSIEDVLFVSKMAVEYRQKFKKDVYIDMVCYRKHGHNESDDPNYTQPEMYHLIDKKKNPRTIYSQYLLETGELDEETIKKFDQDLYNELQDRLNKVKEEEVNYVYRPHEKAWLKMMKARSEDFDKSPETGISKKEFELIANNICKIPEGFTPLKKMTKQLEKWRENMMDKKILDWQAGELLAYGSLLNEGTVVRLSGEDVKRGTFSHRHASIFDDINNMELNRLNQISPTQAKSQIYNSLLSEYGVMGFEFGYSIASPNKLVIWEAQFGDFANGAQIIIDQFVMSSETKWGINSGLVLLLPHGYEGQGPEHSSARLERFLQMCAEFNVQVCNITTPANYFHAIRRQMARNFRIPLIVMSPKSLLRHPACVSPVDDILKGSFQELIDDPTADVKKVTKLLLCSGKIYYDLVAKRQELKRDDIAIIRLEQLYPLPLNQIQDLLKKYSNAKRYVWVQEEPANMGAWTYLLDRQYRLMGDFKLELVSRKTSSSPATGNKQQNYQEVNDIMTKAFD